MIRVFQRSALLIVLTSITCSLGVTSRAGEPAPAPKNDRAVPHLVMIIAEPEYKTNETLPAFADAELAKDFCWSLVLGEKDEKQGLAGLELLADPAHEADALLISVRRRMLPAAQMQLLRKYVAAGKPVIGIRTASHAFSLRGKTPPPGYELWEGFDPEVLGGHYVGHHSNDTQTTIRVAAGAAKHPILAGVDLKQLVGNGSLYRVSPLAKSATPLLIGSIPNKPDEPIAWTNTSSGGGRVFYTSLGHPKDFESPAFRRLLKNGIAWAVHSSRPGRVAHP